MQRRILHVSDSALGGVAAFIETIVPLQLEAGFDVSVAMPEGAVATRLRGAGVAHSPWSASPRPGPGLPGEMRALGRIVYEVTPDLVHLHNDKAGMVGRLLLRRRLPTVFQPHAWSFVAIQGSLGRATLAWERLAARWTDAVVCVSEEEADQARRGGVRAVLVVAPNGVDLERWPAADEERRARARAQLGIGTDTPLALCVGRLHRQKNQGVLLDAWPHVREHVPAAEIALVGDGPDRGALEARAGEGVRFVGETDDVATWLAASDVIVQPSRWEGLSLAVLEALATARPVVASDIPSMRTVVGPDVGALTPPGDPRSLARAVAQRLTDSDRRSREGAAGRALVERAHDVRVQHGTIAGLYERVLVAR